MSYKNSNWYKSMRSKALEGHTSVLEDERRAVIYEEYLQAVEQLELKYAEDRANLVRGLAKQLSKIDYNEISIESKSIL